MVEVETASQICRVSIQLSAVFAVIGVGLLYLAIAISSASIEMKVLWASALSMGVAFAFAIVWTMARDAIRARELEIRRKRVA
jgi:hypothetical protein